MKALIIWLTLATVFICARTTLACSCLGTTSVCGSFAAAQAVFVGTVNRVENKMVKLNDGTESIHGQIAYVQVEESFKGAKASELVFRSYGTSCDAFYKEGQRWLFYASYNKKDQAWTIAACDRSTLIEHAAADLLYLRGLPGSAQKTRLAGVVMDGLDKPMVGVKVKLTGPSQTYEAFTDKNGVYEIYDVPAATYFIQPELPETVKLSMTIASAASHLDRKGKTGVVLKEKGCAGIDFYYKENTSITGRVFGADGLPLNKVCVRLLLKENPDKTPFLLSCTNAQGRFKIDEIDLNDYYLVANDDGQISSDEPFPATYYPGVFEKEKATVLTFTTGDKLEDLDIHIPSQQPTRIVEGRVLFSDGCPVVGASVYFTPDSAKLTSEGEVQRSTNAEGRFRMPVLDGLKGALHAFLYGSDYENCPALEKLNKAHKDIETNRLPLEANRDHRELELIFPFPYCAPSKEP